MIVTLTPNPSFDLTMAIGGLEPGTLHRSETAKTEAGGKGINVSRALARAGTQNGCVFPASEGDGQRLRSLIPAVEANLIDVHVVAVKDGTRTNVTITEPGGQTTKFNSPGPVLSPAESDALTHWSLDAANAQSASWLVACGSLPRGLPTNYYASLVDARSSAIRLAVDASGEALMAAVDAGCDLIKPNTHELSDLVGKPLSNVGEVLQAARSILAKGVGQLLVSMGSDGVLYVSETDVFQATVPAVEVANTVGAGDAALAGFLSGDGQSVEQQVRLAAAWGTAAVQSPTTSFEPPSSSEVEKVNITPPNEQAALEDRS